MRQMCVCCVARSAPPSQFVMSVRSTIVLNVLTPTLVGPMLFVKYNTDDSWSCCIHRYCFIMQHALQGRCAVHHGLFGGPSPSEGKSRAEVGIVNRKVARRARAGQTFPLCTSNMLQDCKGCVLERWAYVQVYIANCC